MSGTEEVDALVIGAGPAGLMAAEALLSQGRRVVLAEAKPSPARKLLMAGKSGLNITKQEAFDQFLAAYGDAAQHLEPMIREFDAERVMSWMAALGQEVFVGSSGRVFPKRMKASPLLRAWLAKLATQGLDLRLRWRWHGFTPDECLFQTPGGECRLRPACMVLALGGASWSRLGSDGRWAEILGASGLALNPFKPTNMGFNVNWSSHMTPFFGAPLKSIMLIAGPSRVRAEAVITRNGLEGGGIYAVSRALREGHGLMLDLFPDLSEQQIAARLQERPSRESISNRFRKALGLKGARLAMVQEFLRPLNAPPGVTAMFLKALPVPLAGPRPLDEAISVAGGIRWDSLDSSLMIRTHPGVFAAGEMIDWEAPTGGYLLTACLATGRWAGRAAGQFRR